MFISKTLSEKEILKDLMLSEKQLSVSYMNSTIESTCPILRDTFINCQINTSWTHYLLKDAYERRGWDRISLASTDDKKTLLDKYSSSQNKSIY